MRKLALAILLFPAMGHADQVAAFVHGTITASIVKVALHRSTEPAWKKVSCEIAAAYIEALAYNAAVKSDETQFSRNCAWATLAGSGIAFSFKF